MKKIIKLSALLLLATMLSGCTFFEDMGKDLSSDIGGLNRVCTITYNDGTQEVLEGKIRIDDSDSTALNILVDGKRYSFYYVSVACVEQ